MKSSEEGRPTQTNLIANLKKYNYELGLSKEVA